MSKHLPEPWTVFESQNAVRPGIDSAIESVVIFSEDEANGVQGDTAEEALANARRIVACVNACQSISTETLENGVIKDMVASLQTVADYFDPLLNADIEELSLITNVTDALAKVHP